MGGSTISTLYRSFSCYVIAAMLEDDDKESPLLLLLVHPTWLPDHYHLTLDLLQTICSAPSLRTNQLLQTNKLVA